MKLRSYTLSGQLLTRHLLVAILTNILSTIILFIVLASDYYNYANDNFSLLVSDTVARWQMDFPLDVFPVEYGFAWITTPDGVVLYYVGNSQCPIGERLQVCAPDLDELSHNQTTLEYQQIEFNVYITETIEQNRVIIFHPMSYNLFGIDLILGFAEFILPFAPTSILITMLFTLPMAILIAVVTANPLVKRLSHISETSQKFSDGNLQARVTDKKSDEIGLLGQQFDSMADVLAQNIHLLRDLAHTNTQLMNQTEEQAIQLERTRLSRELHDDFAQKLFSLSAHSAILPNLIAQNPQASIAQAEIIAQLAEQVNLDLRALLLDLRPVDVIHYGLSDALEALCNQWQTVNHIPVTCTRVLQGKHIPVGVQDAVYRIVQEALHNIAKHANAKSVSVSVVEGNNRLIISITDDGVGFYVDTIPQGRFGLLGIKERARILGGDVSIESVIGQGTTITIQLPIRKESRDD